MSSIFNKDPKSIHIHIPKCAGLTIRNYLRSYNAEMLEEKRHAPVKYFKEELGMHDYFTWAVVRDPLDRAISWYYYHGIYLHRGMRASYQPDIITTGLKRAISHELDYKVPIEVALQAELQDRDEEVADWFQGFNHWVEKWGDLACMDQRTFPNFVDPDAIRFNFATPQTWWLTDSANEFAIDKIVRYEDLDTQFEDIKSMYNYTADLKVANQTKSRAPVDVGIETRKHIERIFKDDYDRLNY